MVFTVQDAINDCVEVTASSDQIHGKFAEVWNAMLRQCNKWLKSGKGVLIPKFGKITWVKTTKKPIFVAADHFVRTHGIFIKKHASTLQTNCVEINYAQFTEADIRQQELELLNHVQEFANQGKKKANPTHVEL